MNGPIAVVRVGLPHHHELVRLRIRQRSEEQRIDDAEDGGAGADADGERENDDRGEAAIEAERRGSRDGDRPRGQPCQPDRGRAARRAASSRARRPRAPAVPSVRAQLRPSRRPLPASFPRVPRRRTGRSGVRRSRRSPPHAPTERCLRMRGALATCRASCSELSARSVAQACSSPAAFVSAATNAAHRPRCAPRRFRPSAVRR